MSHPDVVATGALQVEPPAPARVPLPISLGAGSSVRKGSLWSLAGYGGSLALRFAGNVILTRMLVPEAFGLMALVNALLVGLQLFSDVGIGPGIIQNRRGEDPAYLDTAWTVQVLRGTCLWWIACVVAAPFASFYGEPALAWILPISGVTALLAGFNSTRIFSLYRQVNLARVSMLELGSQVAGLVVMLVVASVERSIWALVAGGIAGSASKLVLSHTLLPGASNHFRWDRSALQPMLRFGRWIFVSTVLSFLVGQSDRLVFGKLVPIATLGVYSVGALIASMPAVALGRMASSVFFPIYSQVHNAGRDLPAAFEGVRRWALLLAGWLTAGLCGGGGAAVRLLYDERYASAGWILQVLALGGWFTVVEATISAALLARGQARWVAAGNAGKLAGMLVLIPTGFALGGFFGAVVGLAGADVAKYAVSAFAASRAGLGGRGRELSLSGWVLVTAGICFAASELARAQGAAPLSVALVAFAAVTLGWAPLGWAEGRKTHRRG